MNPIVIVVDDDDIVLYLHDLMIKESNLSSHPLAFSGGASALEYLRKNYRETETYLIFLDINMPGMNGWQFLEVLEREGFNVSVIIVSSSIDPADFDQSKKYALVKEYVPKPLSIKECLRIKESLVFNNQN